MSYLLDTNVISEVVKSKPNKSVLNWVASLPNDVLYLSVLTLGEIRKGVEKVSDIKRKEKLKVWLEVDLVGWFGERFLNVDAQVCDAWGRLLSQQKSTVSAIDSLIAATAMRHGLTLVTRNEKDFPFESLELINPWKV